MGKGRPRAIEKGVLGQSSRLSPVVSLDIPLAPVYYPNEEEFKDPLDYIYKIRPEAEPYGICKIVPPKAWKPPFALNLDSFTFPTKTQAIHQLQARPASCDSETFELEYNRFLEDHCGRKLRKKIVFEGEELDLCKLFNAVKRFGGYDKAVKDKKWAEIYRIVRPSSKISECAKHVLSQLYSEHLYDYEEFYNKINKEVAKSCKREISEDRKSGGGVEKSNSRKRRKNNEGENVKMSKVEKVEVDNQICEQCKSGLHGEVMLLCDRCDKGWHIYCLSPPLKQVPLGNWYCYECLNSDKDSFGFVPGKHYSIETFRRIAERAKRKWFGSLPASRVQIEKKFWEIVEGSLGEVEVMYGSDLDTSIYGSGFPRINDQKPESVDAKVWDEYCTSPWNLNNLPKLKGSMLQAVHHSIAGVMVPWLYIGMLFSAFCWHFEDHCFYSMNYHHWGEPKCWYSIPGSEASAFEKVMRNTLPDLFDAQPDLLFQLITMLNPSVLQKNGVPVYSVLQEPGNFVITFPRSYHGGFNFGLNCAEAVNFAPADWLPHGGFGAELYKLYHKAPVLSHDELLCVVAKSNWDGKVSIYLKEELVKMYTKEKYWREHLWRNGIVKSSPLPPRKCPEYVGTEEDPTCIICLQYLYLSAVVCRCRQTTYVCLEHWEHLCECKPSKHRLLYRHTLAELSSLVHKIEYQDIEEASQIKILKQMTYNCKEVGALGKKTKRGQASMAQLADQWILRSSQILQEPFSVIVYNKALKEAEQYLWAGSEMDPVRDVTKSLIVAKTWAEGIRACILKIEIWLSQHRHNREKADLLDIEELLNFSPQPCNEPKYFNLKEYAEEARMLKQEINTALSTCLNISEMEHLYTKACDLPIHVQESEKLARKISSAKVWISKAKECLLDKHCGAVELDFLYKLKSEISELQVHFPETEILLDLLRKAESCQAKCCELLRSPLTLKIVEDFLQELDTLNVDSSEFKILRQHYKDAVSWTSYFKDFMVNIGERQDQDSLIDELTSIMKDGKCLRISVDELSLVEIELRKACCRGKAMKVHNMRVSLEFVQQVISEASMLQIEKEKLFLGIADTLAAAMDWEERAKLALASETQMCGFCDLIRASEDIAVVLPSLADVKNALSAAKSWLERAKPFLDSDISTAPAAKCFLKVADLKELVSESKLLKVSLKEEYGSLETVLKKCEKWELDACSLLQEVECLSKINNIGDGGSLSVIPKLDNLVASLEAILKSGLSLGFDFGEIPKLQNACSFLQWCSKAFSLCSVTPSLQEVEGLLEAAKDISGTFSSGFLWSTLVGWVQWVKKAVWVLSISNSDERCNLSEAEDILAASQLQNKKELFAPIISQLAEAIGKHKEWQEQVLQYFNLQSGERNWSSLIRLKETGKMVALGCSEWDMVISEVMKVENWMQHCRDIFGKSAGDASPLLGAFQKIKECVDKSMHTFDNFKSCRAEELCICCSCVPEEQEYVICLACKTRYHLQCLGYTLNEPNAAKMYQCHYCQIWESGSVVQIREVLMRSNGKHVDLKRLIELLEHSKDFYARIAEKYELEQLVERAITFKACLTELAISTSACLDKDLSIPKVILVALKMMEVAGIYDLQVNCDLELAIGRHCWRRRANNLLEGKQKPSIQQVKQLLKEGLAVDMPSGDFFWGKLSEMKHHCLHWIEYAKKVSADSGALSLDKVFDLILEGENMPINVEKELKLLRTRSMLYCICRKPYDQRAMIACDQCDEWYHFDCIRLVSVPKVFICLACSPQTEDDPCSSPVPDYCRSTSAISVEPQTPSPRYTKARKEPRNSDDCKVSIDISDRSNVLRSSSGIDQLWWRNRKPFRRSAKKRVELESLSPFFSIKK